MPVYFTLRFRPFIFTILRYICSVASFGRLTLIQSGNKTGKQFIDFTLDDIRVHAPAIKDISPLFTYFILHASYGDKWLILSLLSEHFRLYSSSKVIADLQDKELISLFLPYDLILNRFIFIDHASLGHISSFFRPVSRLSLPLADTWYTEGCMHTITPYFIEHGLPTGTIRHLHLVYYPYFNELMNLHGVSMGTLIKTILYLPATAQPFNPSYYTPTDRLVVQTFT